MSTLMYRIRSLCCPRAASGHATTAPPSSVMNLVGAREQSRGHFETESPLPAWEVRLSPTHVAEPSDVGDSSSRRAAWPDGKT
jgi:hypothetical protein